MYTTLLVAYSPLCILPFFVISHDMNGFIESCKPLLKKYWFECALLSTAFCIGSVSLLLFMHNSEAKTTVQSHIEAIQPKQEKKIVVDVSGAVHKPFVYTFAPSARFIDAIHRAGGLTDEADKAFVARNVNYARILSDQEKIYIPSLIDTANGIIGENKRTIEYIQPNTFASVTNDIKKTNINSASALQLDQLPGVGKVQAQAIISNKPYNSIEDIVEKGIVTKSTYEKIRELISVY